MSPLSGTRSSTKIGDRESFFRRLEKEEKTKGSVGSLCKFLELPERRSLLADELRLEVRKPGVEHVTTGPRSLACPAQQLWFYQCPRHEVILVLRSACPRTKEAIKLPLLTVRGSSAQLAQEQKIFHFHKVSCNKSSSKLSSTRLASLLPQLPGIEVHRTPLGLVGSERKIRRSDRCGSPQ